MQFKDGVVIESIVYRGGVASTVRLVGQITKAMQTIDEISKRLTGKEAVITSGIDGQHMAGSKHYTGEAIDVRKRIYSSWEIDQLLYEIIQALGPNYDVVNEQSHFHIEWDPKN